jgi:membrane protease subunit (stomatin/prohibitin family)
LNRDLKKLKESLPGGCMWGSIKNQLRSVIEWKNPSSDAIMQLWSTNHDEIKNASKLLVGPGQGCIFIYEGKVVDVYTKEGLVELTTANIPFWTTVSKFMQAFQSEHKTALYFFKTSQLVNLGWGTTSVIKYQDPVYNFPVSLRVHGNFSVKIDNAQWFVQNVSGIQEMFTAEDLRKMMSSRFLQPLTNAFAKMKYSFAEIDSHRMEVAQTLMTDLKPEFATLGFNLLDFRIEGTSFDEETMNRINRIADMSAEGQAAKAVGLSYAQIQQLEALKEAAKNQGGVAGIGIGAGVGLGLGQQMAGVMGNMNSGAMNSGNANSEDPAVRLKNLKNLLDQNLISQEEFDQKKKEILSKI